MNKRNSLLVTLLSYDRLHLRALAREIGLHPSTVKKFVLELENEGVLNLTKDDKLLISFADTKKAMLTKTYFLQMQLLQTTLLTDLNDILFEPTIILFGSCAKGEMTKESDIDICVICDEPKEFSVTKYEEFLGREIHLFTYTKTDFRKLPKELRNNVLNGIVLQGFIEAYE
ncbi:MAG: nucleotidyltransferase domain-containing protein [Candidatus Woesearchaeota archaeon]